MWKEFFSSLIGFSEMLLFKLEYYIFGLFFIDAENILNKKLTEPVHGSFWKTPFSTVSAHHPQ